MASGFSFSGEDTMCEGCNTEDTAHVSYRVEVRQKLCDGCAHDKQDSINTAEWFCQKHLTDKAKILCTTHDVPICEACAITTHSKGCSLGDIDDTLKDRKEELVRLIEMSKTNEETFCKQMRSLDDELVGLDKHFALEEEKLRKAYEREVKKLEDTFKDRQRKLKDASTRLRDMTEHLRDKPEKKRKDLVAMRILAEALLTNKNDLMKDFKQVNNSLTCLTSKTQPEINMDIVKKIKGVANKVSYTETDSQPMGTITIPDEAWTLNSEYNPEIGACSYMMGVIDGVEVVIKDTDKHSIYVVNIEARFKKRVVKSNSPYDLWRCVPFRMKDGSPGIVCGSNNGEIVICDRSWKVLLAITVAESSPVCVAVNKDRFILANAIGSSTIGIYDPDDGKLVRSIVTKTPIYDMCALASGNIVVLNECVEGIDVSILDETGETLASKHYHGEGIKSLVVDRAHDLIYLLSWDRQRRDYKVCVVSTSAEVVADRVAVCHPSVYSPSCAIPRPDRIIIFSDGKLLNFRKTQRGFHQLIAEIKQKEAEAAV